MVRAIGSYPIGHKFESHRRYHEHSRKNSFYNISAERARRPVGQAVKTPPFHGGNMGSSPVRVTKERHLSNDRCLSLCPLRVNANPLVRASRLCLRSSPRAPFKGIGDSRKKVRLDWSSLSRKSKSNEPTRILQAHAVVPLTKNLYYMA